MTKRYLHISRIIAALTLLLVMGVGNAWADKWDGTVASSFAGGSGTQADPYIISNAAQLAYFGSQMNGKDWYVKLTTDIDLDNREWTYGKNSATNFKGHFDGAGHTIKKFKLAPVSAKNNGFFSSLQGTATSRAEVKCLVFDSVTIAQTTDLAATTITGTLAGNVTEYTDIDSVIVRNTSISFKNLTNANYIGALVGRVEKNKSTFTRCAVVKPVINITGEIKGGASYIGGAIGQVAGSTSLVSTVDSLVVTTPTLSIYKISIKDCYVGAVFGRVNTYSTISRVNVSTKTGAATLTYTNNGAPNVALNLGIFAGGIFGVDVQETAVTKVQITGDAQMAIGSTNDVKGIKAGIIGQATTNVRMEDWTIANSEINIKGNLATTTCQLGGFIGYVATAAKAPVTFKRIKITGNSTISVSGNVAIASQLGGFAGYLSTADATNNTLKVDTASIAGTITVSVGGNVSAASHFGGFVGQLQGRSRGTNILQIDSIAMGDVKLTIGDASSAASFYGGLVGYVTQGCKLNNWKVGSTDVKIKGNITAAPFIGSAIGSILAAASYPSSVTNITIGDAALATGTTTAHTLVGAKVGMIGQASTNVLLDKWSITGNNSITVNGELKTTADYVGGFVGYAVSAASAPTIIKRISMPGTTTVNLTGNVTIATYVGGAIGDCLGVATDMVTVDTLNIKPTVTVNKVAVKDCSMGAVFGRINTYSEVDSITVSNPAFTYNNTDNQNFVLNLGTFAGYIVGNATKEVPVTHVTIKGTAQLTIGTEAKKTTAEIKAIKAGLVGMATTNVRLQDWKIENTNVTVLGKLTTTASQMGGFAGNLTAASNMPTIVKNIHITGKSSLSVFSNLQLASQIGGCIGYITGASSSLLYINKIKIDDSCTLEIGGDVTTACYLGGFAGQINSNARIEANTITNPSVTIGGEIKTTNNSYIGGAIGHFTSAAGNTAYIDTLTVTNPKAVIGKVSVTSRIGAVFGMINNYTNINAVNVSNPTLTYSAAGNPSIALYLGTFAGYLAGVNAQETPVTNVTITGTANLTIGTEANKATTNLSNVRAGLLGHTTTNVRMEDWTVANTTLTAYGSLTTTADYFGGLAGSMESGSSAPLTIKNVKVTGNSTVNVTGNIGVGSYLGGFAGAIGQGNVTYSQVNIDGAGVDGVATVSVGGNVTTASYVGGFTGYLYGKNAVGNQVKANNVTAGTINLTITGQTTAGSYYGGLAGRVNTMCELSGWNVKTAANLTFNNSITALSFVGGAIGSMDGTASYPVSATGFDIKGIDINLNCNLTNGLYVGGLAGQLNAIAQTNKIEKSSVSGKIRTTGSHTFAPGNITYAFGGVVGYMPQSTTTFSEVNNCVSEVNFDLSGLKSSSVSGSNHNLYSGLVVGGVIGRINTPSRLPEALYYSGKIYAPFAAVAPIVGVFVTNSGAAAYLYDDYTGENLKTTVISDDEWVKADDWYFNGYKLGLSTDVTTQTARTKNYSATPVTIDGISYLTIGENTLTNFNSISGVTKKSKTILIYDTNNKNQDKGIYPQWATNSTTYPAYYMYYMQGVNRGKFVENARVENLKDSILTGKLTLLALIDANADFTLAANRGVKSHALTAKSSGAESFKWYIDGVLQTETSENFAITPAFNGNTISVEAIKGGKPLKKVELKVNSVLRVGDVSAETYGTKVNPYLIGSAAELQLLSYLSTLPTNIVPERTYTSASHYNKAYYELDADIDLSEVTAFTPISFATGYVDAGAISTDYIFDGVFDGKGYKISNLTEDWYGGAIGLNNAFLGWGLFSIVGSSTATVKVGDTETSPAAIRNLIIDGATLKHQTTNKTFNYNNNTANNNSSNNVGIGVLAGIVLNNTKIDNIEIRNSKITDEGSIDYSLATRGLYVGGAVGSIQNAFNEEVNAPVNTKMQHIAAQVDITLEHPFFASDDATGQIGLFNIGGIIGRYCATSGTQDQAQMSMPGYTLYSGSVTASKAWISPVLGALRYATQQGVTWANYSKIWEGNNNTVATQITITNAQYYNFRINGELITELYPTGSCDMGTRHIAAHADATEAIDTYFPNKYQGVNYNARFIDSEGTTMRYLNEGVTDGVYWTWQDGFPHMTDQPYKGAHLVVASSNLTANMENGTASAYRWEVSKDGETWTEIDGATLQNYKVAPSSQDTRLFVAIITSDGVEYRTQAEVIWPENDLFSPFVTTTGNSTDGYDFTLNWPGDEDPSDPFAATYQWYKDDRTTALDGQTSKSLHLSQDELDASNGIVWCAVTIQESGALMTTIYVVGGDVIVVFVDNKNGRDNPIGDRTRGWTPETAVKTLDNANLLLRSKAEGGRMENNYVVIIGKLNTGCFISKGTNPATLTGKWAGINYKGLISLNKTGEGTLNEGDDPTKTGTHNYVLADTKLEYLTIYSEINTDQINFHCHGHDVWFGRGLVMSNFQKQDFSHTNLYREEIPAFSIILTATDLCHLEESYWEREKPQVLTIESGHYGRILGGRLTSGFFSKPENTVHTIQGTPKHPCWAIINIDIDPDNRMTSAEGKKYMCDVNLLCAGLTDGSIYEDLEINIHGGVVNTIVGANQGNAVVNGTKSITPVGGTTGAYGEWPNSSFFGRTIINVEQNDKLKPIMIRNMYGGGLGRSVSSKTGIIVDMYEYGRTEINMKSGTVLGNIYGGGVGGVLGANPWDPRIPYASDVENDAANTVQNWVQYGGKPAGSPWAKVTLHNRNVDGTYSTEEMDLSQSSTTINISGGTIGGGINGGPIEGNIYGGGDGEVSNMDNTICLQGVGSVFGTSNINITGGTILGSVYGGSKGSSKYYNLKNAYGQTITHIAEMNGEVNISITGTDVQYPTIGGTIYGAGLGIKSTATEEYLRIATAGNTDLGDEYKTNINITIDMPESIEFPNDIYGGGALGKVDGNTNIILKRGTFIGNIYGAGYGELNHRDKARVTGTTNIYTGDSIFANIVRTAPVIVEPSATDDTKVPTIYGGGNMAQVTGNTFINFWHGNITADVYGGGRGLSEAESAGYSGYGWVYGNTRVLYNNITPDNRLTGNVYGGGALGAVQGNTTVVIKAGEVEGDVFGGGKGEEGSDKAKVTGTTEVIVDSEWTEE